MCEISVIDPSANDVERLVSVVKAMYRLNDDGIGLIAVYPEDGKFGYSKYKNTDFDRDSIAGFLGGNKDAGAWRIIVHARYATAGGVNYDATHPIDLDCPECEADMVVHNGIVTGHQSWMESMEDEGHEFTTEVDTEVIAHSISDIPETLNEFNEDEFKVTGSLNFLVLGEDRILIRSGTKYQDRPESFLMGRSRRCAWDGEFSKQWMLVKPDKSVETMEASISTRTTSRRSRTSGSSYWSGWYNPSTDNEDEDNDDATEEDVEDVEDNEVDIDIEWEEEDWLYRYKEYAEKQDEVSEDDEEPVETAEEEVAEPE